MITISCTREDEGETRVALTPETTKKFKGLRARFLLEARIGERSCMHDGRHQGAGAKSWAAPLRSFQAGAQASIRRDGGKHAARLADRGCEKRAEAQA